MEIELTWINYVMKVVEKEPLAFTIGLILLVSWIMRFRNNGGSQ